jgi:hypothetical protein
VSRDDVMQAARRRMLEAQKAVMEYEAALKTNPPDPKRFNRLFSRLQVCTDEYLGLVMKHLHDRYANITEKTGANFPNSKTA